jgi:hypothetical protein
MRPTVGAPVNRDNAAAMKAVGQFCQRRRDRRRHHTHTRPICEICM